MQISKISNTNFGNLHLSDIEVFSESNLTQNDKRRIRDLTYALNEDVAKNISVYAQVGRPEATNYKKAIRIITAPTQEDMAVIKAMRPNANRRDYKRRSKWVHLDDRRIFTNLANFIQKQKGYIYHCIIDPDHNTQPFDQPKWKTREVSYTNPHKKSFFMRKA